MRDKVSGKFERMSECVVEDYSVVVKVLDLLAQDNIIARKAKVELLKHFPCLEDVLNNN